jgi:hypothetical protein
MNARPGTMWIMVNRGCLAKPESKTASGELDDVAGGKKRWSILRITTATPMNASKKVRSQIVRTIAGLGFIIPLP